MGDTYEALRGLFSGPTDCREWNQRSRGKRKSADKRHGHRRAVKRHKQLMRKRG